MLPTSPLLRLPDELLADVFADVEPQIALGLMRVCKRLRPIARARAFSTVVVASHSRFAVLAARIEEIGDLIKDLTLDRGPSHGDNAFVAAEPVAELFQHLPALETLRLTTLNSNQYNAILGAAALEQLGRLRTLEMGVPRDLDDEELPRQWWSAFARYGQLEELTLDGCAYAIIAEATNQSEYTVAGLKCLRLRLNWHWYDAPTQCAVRFPALRVLIIESSDDDLLALCPALLRGFESTLQRLEIHESSRSGDDRTPAHLERLTGLRHLLLGRGRVVPNSLVKVLPSLEKLESLTFGAGARASDDLLDSLLEEPPVLPALRRLTLNHVRCERGPTRQSMGGRLPTPKEAAFSRRMYRGWREPDWPADCTEYGIRAAVRLGDKLGVAVDGTAIGAIDYERDYNDELFDCLWTYGAQRHDFTELVDTFDWAVAHDCLLEVDKAWAAKVKRDAIARGTPDFYRWR